MWAIIGGSGFEKFTEFKIIEELDGSTPFGPCSTPLLRIAYQDNEALFIPRHGDRHQLLPSEVNYRANIFAAKYHGAKKIVAISAVGSLRAELAPGDLVIPSQFIDWTKGKRQHTFCGNGIVGHVSWAHPVDHELVNTTKALLEKLAITAHYDKTYICIEGPLYSSQAESAWYRTIGADIIGMTNSTECALAREAGMYYLPLTFVTDYDCWDDAIPHVTVEQVTALMKLNYPKAITIIKELLVHITQFSEGCKSLGLANGLLTPLSELSASQRQWLEVICG